MFKPITQIYFNNMTFNAPYERFAYDLLNMQNILYGQPVNNIMYSKVQSMNEMYKNFMRIDINGYSLSVQLYDEGRLALLLYLSDNDLFNTREINQEILDFEENVKFLATKLPSILYSLKRLDNTVSNESVIKLINRCVNLLPINDEYRFLQEYKESISNHRKLSQKVNPELSYSIPFA